MNNITAAPAEAAINAFFQLSIFPPYLFDAILFTRSDSRDCNPLHAIYSPHSDARSPSRVVA
jgi:hypothetical protein